MTGIPESPPSLTRRIDVPRVGRLAWWLGGVLAFHVLVHVWGLLEACRSAGEARRFAREATVQGLDRGIVLYGEIQPLGVLEESAGVLVTFFLVGLLTAAVRHLRAGGAADALPSRLWLVALLAAIRPRRVVDELWRRTAPSDGRAPGAWLLDVLWPLWLLTTVAMRAGDHAAGSAATVDEFTAAVRIQIAAEAGYVVLGVLLLWLSVSLTARVRGDATGVAVALVVPVAGAILAPVLVLGAALTYASAERGPSVAELRAQVHVAGVWDAREQAAGAGSGRALRAAASGPALAADLAGLRRQRDAGRRVRWQRELAGLTVLTHEPDATRLVAVAHTQGNGSWTEPLPDRASGVVVLSRSRPGAPWRLRLDVPLVMWPWAWSSIQGAYPRPDTDVPWASDLLRRSLGVERVTDVTVVWLRDRRALVCGAAPARARDGEPVQGCVATDDAGAVVVVGRSGPAPERESLRTDS